MYPHADDWFETELVKREYGAAKFAPADTYLGRRRGLSGIRNAIAEVAWLKEHNARIEAMARRRHLTDLCRVLSQITPAAVVLSEWGTF